MPYKPKHPCAADGCAELVEPGERYCEKHRKEAARTYEKYGRDRSVRRRYGRAWTRIRARYAREHPFCEQCFERGVIVPVEEVHHIIPLAEGGTHDPDNLISLCKSCHSRIHAKRGDRWGKNRREGR